MVATNILGYSDDFSFTLFDIFIYSSIPFVLIVCLLWYYKKISTGEKSILNDFSEQPFYQSRDILLQEKSFGNTAEFIPVKTSVSVFTKIILVILVLTVLFTPLYELLNTGYFI